MILNKIKRNANVFAAPTQPIMPMTNASLKREAKRYGRLRVIRYCPNAKQVVVETIGA